MPLVGYNLIGFDKGPLSFTETDIRLLTSSRHRQRTEDFFANTPFRFNLVFHNRNWGPQADDPTKYTRKFLLHGCVRPSTYKYMAAYRERINYFLDNNRPDYRAINIVYTNNGGNSRFFIPMTPWIMAHRMGHIQMLAYQNHKLMDHTLEWGTNILRDLYDYEFSFDGRPTVDVWNTKLRPYVKKPHADARVFHGLFVHLLTTRAARDHHVTPWFEYYSEWMAQYIRFNRLKMPEFLPDLDLTILIDEPDRPLVPFPKEPLMVKDKSYPTTPFREKLEHTYNEILRNWIGQVVVT